MLKEIFSVLRSGRSLDDAFSEFLEMLDHARWMFDRASAVLRNEACTEESKNPIYSRDQAINDLERSIRRKILRHLIINPAQDAPACLILMSVAKDAERIGDYCKNVFEVGRFYREGFHVAEYHEPLERVRQETLELFTVVSAAFKDSNVKQARTALEAAGRIRASCDEVIERLLREDVTIQVHEAVAYSLLARHYKRVAAHLANIATAVLGRIEELDFLPGSDEQPR